MDDLFMLLLLLSLAALIIGMIKPKSVIRWGKNRGRKRVVLVYGTAAMASFVLFGVTSDTEDQKPREISVDIQKSGQPSYLNSNALKLEERNRASLPEYRIIKDDLYEIPLKTQVEMDCIVGKHVSRQSLEDLLISLHYSILARSGFKYHPKPTNIYVRLFTSEERANASIKKPIASISSVDGESAILIDDSQMAQLSVQPEERHGISETERMRIYKEYQALLARAFEIAEEQNPIEPAEFLKPGDEYRLSRNTPLMPEIRPSDPMAALAKMRTLPAQSIIHIKRVESDGANPWYYVRAVGSTGSQLGNGWINSLALFGQSSNDITDIATKLAEKEEALMEEYRRELLRKYNVSEEDLDDIYDEGIAKSWPF